MIIFWIFVSTQIISQKLFEPIVWKPSFKENVLHNIVRPPPFLKGVVNIDYLPRRWRESEKLKKGVE